MPNCEHSTTSDESESAFGINSPGIFPNLPCAIFLEIGVFLVVSVGLPMFFLAQDR